MSAGPAQAASRASSDPARRIAEADTLTAGLRRTAAERPDAPAFGAAGQAALTWGEVAARSRRLAGGLRRLGVRPGATVGLLMANRPEFHLVDLAVLQLRAVPVSLYRTASPAQIAALAHDAAFEALVVDAAGLARIAEAERDGPVAATLVAVEPVDDPRAVPLAELERAGDPGALPDPTPDDLATLIYTSGTTGEPKGVELTHRNVLASLAATVQALELPADGEVVSWLPAAHIAERAAHHYLPALLGWRSTSWPDPRTIGQALRELRPTWFFAVPRVFEKLAAAVPDDPGPPERQAHVRAAMGLDRARALSVSAAPIAPDVLRRLHSVGLPVAELWGMSETASCGTANPPGRMRVGTVGLPAPGAEVRLADDGELLVRGPFVMRGYRNRPDETAAAIDEHGWLATGDLAAIDADGYVTVTGRKKDLLITSGGKNIAPAAIEAAIVSTDPRIEQAAVVGDRRPFCVALVAFEPGGDAETRHALAAAAVAKTNRTLSRVEQVKRVAVVDEPWLPGGPFVTATGKLRRAAVLERHAALIEQMYAPEWPDVPADRQAEAAA